MALATDCPSITLPLNIDINGTQLLERDIQNRLLHRENSKENASAFDMQSGEILRSHYQYRPMLPLSHKDTGIELSETSSAFTLPANSAHVVGFSTVYFRNKGGYFMTRCTYFPKVLIKAQTSLSAYNVPYTNSFGVSNPCEI